MRDFIILFIRVMVTVVRLAGPGRFRSVVAESALIRHQQLILDRGRQRAPNLRASDRLAAGLLSLSMIRARILRSAIVLKPSTLLHLHNLLRKRKYRLLFSPKSGPRPGPKGPNKEIIDAVVAMKRRNPSWGCPRIAQQMALALGVEIDKDVVRGILGAHYRPESDSAGPSWLTFLGHIYSRPCAAVSRSRVKARKAHRVPVIVGDPRRPQGTRQPDRQGARRYRKLDSKVRP